MKKILYCTILASLCIGSLLNITLGEKLYCKKCRLAQCKDVGYITCGRFIICTGHCYRGTSTVSYSLCMPGGPDDTCDKIGIISCGPREVSDCSGWPKCQTCDDYKKDGYDIYVPYC
jgi:hypothetical protein